MADQDELYLENLDEFVNDENKIVTYKGLSNLLKVPANRSKEMLQNFVDQQESKGIQLSITFLIGGKLTEGGLGYKFLLATKDNLEDTKKVFSQVTCCHIYSVQKSKLKNFEVLHDTDHDMVKDSLFELCNWSHIHCQEAKLSDAALRRRQAKVLQPVLPNGVHSSSQKTTEDSIKEAPLKQSSAATKKQVTSASFFGGNSKTQKKAPSDEQKKPVKGQQTEEEKSKHNKNEKTEPSFFGKPAQAQNKSHAKASKDVEIEQEKVATKSHSEAASGKEVEQAKAPCEDKTKRSDKKAKKKVKEEVKTKEDESLIKEKQPSKKAKRSKDEDGEDGKKKKAEVEESESDDDFESFIKVSRGEEKSDRPEKKKSKNSTRGEKRKKEQPLEFEETSATQRSKKAKKQRTEEEASTRFSSEESSQKTDDVTGEEGGIGNSEESEIPPSGHDVIEETKLHEKRRIRRKVMKSKTFMNDDGYMVTEKVYESESASEESETEAKTKAAPNDAVHKKPKEITAENKKMKAEASKQRTQSSLMSFFKKK